MFSLFKPCLKKLLIWRYDVSSKKNDVNKVIVAVRYGRALGGAVVLPAGLRTFPGLDCELQKGCSSFPAPDFLGEIRWPIGAVVVILLPWLSQAVMRS